MNITEYQVHQPKREHFVITTPDSRYISSGGRIWWKLVSGRVEVISPEDEQYLSKLLHGHEVMGRMEESLSSLKFLDTGRDEE